VKLNPQGLVDNLPPEAQRHLAEFHSLLRDRALPLGLISSRDQLKLWERHILDSVRGLPCLSPGPQAVADVGSGAGLPGVPIAICRPDMEVFLVEPRARRAAFLELAVERLTLPNAKVVAASAERAQLSVDLALARALASPGKAWALAKPLLAPGGRLLLWAGRTWSDAQAQELDREGAACQICAQPGFSWQGPLVMIGGT
jgi:16S rRNA (guanine527-N7)-methyltransferase